MKKVVFILLIMFSGNAVAQTIIELDFPKLGSRDTAWIYSFAGSSIDSFSVVLNKQGKAKVAFPKTGYRGFAYLYFSEKGGGEMIIAGERTGISCPDEQFNGGMLKFSGSSENEFLRWIFQQRGLLLGRKEWLETGKELKGDKKDDRFIELFDEQLSENEKAIKQFNDSVSGSPLYAARFMELTLFMQRLYGVVRTPADTAAQRALQKEMENTLDLNSLYTSGNLWNDVHEYYPGLFIGADSDSVQSAYAASIMRTAKRLPEPVSKAFIASAIAVSERTNRPKAKEILSEKF